MQMGLSWQAHSVRHIYTAHHRVGSVHSRIGCLQPAGRPDGDEMGEQSRWEDESL